MSYGDRMTLAICITASASVYGKVWLGGDVLSWNPFDVVMTVGLYALAARQLWIGRPWATKEHSNGNG